jgi:hypothetical protein
MNLIEFSRILKSEETCLSYFISQRIIYDHHNCPICNRLMILMKKNRCVNNYVWRCRFLGSENPHDKEIGIYKGSIFENSKLPARKLLVIIYECSFESLVC